MEKATTAAVELIKEAAAPTPPTPAAAAAAAIEVLAYRIVAASLHVAGACDFLVPARRVHI
jgi:hypothetical protein